MTEYMRTASMREKYQPENRYEYLNVTDLYQLDSSIANSQPIKEKRKSKGTSGWPNSQDMTYQV